MKKKIENHYFKTGLLEEIVAGLEAKGINLKFLTRADISGVDEFHVRGSAVSEEIANSIDLRGLKVLDVGCCLGGPCRMLADKFDCTTTGIDISYEYIRTANELSKLTNLDDKTSFVQGEATNLPFDDNTYDVVWTQHVQMNIPDKFKFYSEINRVLKSGGHFLYYDIFKNRDGRVMYPLPWAESRDISFLFKAKEMESILTGLGLIKKQSTNQTRAGINFIENLISNLEKYGLPAIGLNLLMGKTTEMKLINLLTNLKNDKLNLQSGVYLKSNAPLNVLSDNNANRV